MLAQDRFSEGVGGKEGCGKPSRVRGGEWGRGSRVVLLLVFFSVTQINCKYRVHKTEL